jgi:hypothetical protein
MSIGAFARKAQEVSPTFSVKRVNRLIDGFWPLIDKDSSILTVLNPTVYSRDDKMLISFKWIKLQIFENRRYKHKFTLDGNWITFTNKEYVDMIGIHNIVIYSQSDIKADSLLNDYFIMDEVFVVSLSIEHLHINDFNVHNFENSLCLSIKNLTIEFSLKRKNCSKDKWLLKLVKEKIFNKKWEVENFYIKVSLLRIAIAKNGTFQQEIMDVLGLPIKEFILNLSWVNLKNFSKESLHQLFQCIIGNKELKHLTISSSKFEEFKFRHLDLKTPDEEDLKRVKTAVYNAIYNFEACYELVKPKDLMRIMKYR